MEKQIIGQPPSYDEVINTPIDPSIGNFSTQPTYPVPPNPGYPINIPDPSKTYHQSEPLPPTGYVPSYGTMGAPTATIIPTEIIVVGGCPACRIGILQDDYSCLGMACAILLFPVGILCCLALRQKRCTHCGAEF